MSSVNEVVRRFWREHYLLVMVLIACSVRLGIGYPWETGDTARYLNQADHILAGRGYGQDGQLDVRLPPGYPVFLAGLRFFSKSEYLVYAIQLVLSVMSCVNVYFAARTRSEQAGRIALALMALSPYLAWHSRALLSETFGVFLMSILVLSVVRSATSERTLWAVVAGMALVACVLTSPATLFLSAAVGLALCWNLRSSVRRLVGVAAGVLVFMIPWQMHCVSAMGNVCWTVLRFDQYGTSAKGFRDWRRTWTLYPAHGQVQFSQTKFETITPDWAFASAQQRDELTRLRGSSTQNSESKKVADERFRAAALERKNAFPILCRFVLPTIRSVAVWFDPDYLWPAQTSYIGRLLPHDLVADWFQHGAARAILRYGKAMYSTFVGTVNTGYAVAFLFFAVYALRSRQPIAVAIVLGVLLYSVAGGIQASHEIRRNLVFYPALAFLCSYCDLRRLRIGRG